MASYDNKEKPEVGRVAIDLGDVQWEIIEFCKNNDDAKVKELIGRFDDSGVFREMKQELDDEIGDYYVVGAIDAETHSEKALWVWENGGLYYND